MSERPTQNCSGLSTRERLIEMAEQRSRDLVAVSVHSTKIEPYFGPDFVLTQSAKIVLKSTVHELNATFQTNPIGGELVERVQLLQSHGFTVVEAPENWRYGAWQDAVLRRALERVAAIYRDGEPSKRMSGYNEQLADAVLRKLYEVFPAEMHMHTLKDALGEPEPSDDELGAALQALYLDGLITGDPMYDYQSGTKELATMARVLITSRGKDKIAGRSDASGTIVHGDQYNSFGNTGAMGKGSTGTIQYQQQWNQISGQVNTQQLAHELEILRAELHKRASTRADIKQVGLIAEAEEQAENQEGSKVMETLSKVGKGALEVAKEVGIEVAASVIEKALFGL